MHPIMERKSNAEVGMFNFIRFKHITSLQLIDAFQRWNTEKEYKEFWLLLE